MYTAKQFISDLNYGCYAWPGGYPRYFVCSDGESLSFVSAQQNRELIVEAIESCDNTGGWCIIGCDINWDDPNLYCADLGLRIPSA